MEGATHPVVELRDGGRVNGTRTVISTGDIRVLSGLMRKKRICVEFNQANRRGGVGIGDRASTRTTTAVAVIVERGGRKTSLDVGRLDLYRCHWWLSTEKGNETRFCVYREQWRGRGSFNKKIVDCIESFGTEGAMMLLKGQWSVTRKYAASWHKLESSCRNEFGDDIPILRVGGRRGILSDMDFDKMSLEYSKMYLRRWFSKIALTYHFICRCHARFPAFDLLPCVSRRIQFYFIFIIDKTHYWKTLVIWKEFGIYN